MKLQADNERLRQEQAAAVPDPTAAGPSTASSVSSVPPTRDKKCPMFRGRSGIGLTEWLEEVHACMRACHLSAPDRAFFFLFDHLEGEAREEIRSAEEWGDPTKNNCCVAGAVWLL